MERVIAVREVSTVRSYKSFGLLVLLLVLLGNLGYLYRPQITAILWHWRHGNSIRVAPYQIPVPRGWFAIPIPYGVELTSAHSSIFRGSETANVLIWTNPTGKVDLEFWKSFTAHSLESRGFTTEEQTLSAGGELVVCVSGTRLLDARKKIVVELGCTSEHELSLMFLGPQSKTQEFYGITSQIRRLAAH